MYDGAVIGAGMAGLATAARLQAQGLSTIVFEAHGQPGGCAAFFRRKGFAFDVGATTLVDFEPGGIGGMLLSEIGMPPLEGDVLGAYLAWLPDRRVTLYRDPSAWADERRRCLGNTPHHRCFWRLLDRLAAVFWRATRDGVKLPILGPGDLFRVLRCIRPEGWSLLRYAAWTVGDALRSYGLQSDRPLVGLLSMLVEDTVHARLEEAPLINAALGITIRSAGLSRPRGGMCGFWRRFVPHYRELGGTLRVGCPVQQVRRLGKSKGDGFLLRTRRGDVPASQVVSAVPVSLTSRLAPPEVSQRLRPYLQRDATAQGGAIVVFLGVPEIEVGGQVLTHHQLLQDYRRPLGNGNNMFISVSSAGDVESAPAGCRSVMISTHCDLAEWESLKDEEYHQRKAQVGRELINLARRVYPDLGRRPVVYEVATPCTFARFTRRPQGAVGGVRQTLWNTNQHAVPHDIGVEGFWLAGDTTWPGLGTVACVAGSRLVAEGVLSAARTVRRTGHRGEPRACQPQCALVPEPGHACSLV